VQGKRLLFNTVVMTVTHLILRSAGLVFQIFISKRMGAEGIGLFQLVMSVSSFAATVAISGIRFTATRLVSEELGLGTGGNVERVVKRCCSYASVTGCAAGIILCLSARLIGVGFIGDERTVLSLRILGSSLPFIAVGAVYAGYFTGTSRVGSSAAAALSEQVFKIIGSVAALTIAPKDNIELMCAAVVCGNAVGEVMSYFVSLIMYRADIRRCRGMRMRREGDEMRRIMGIAVPLALSAYARTALNSVQNILVPKGLRRSGSSYEAALAGYGTIQGMVFPIITFPSVVFSSISELIVPELTEEQVRGRDERISSASNLLLKCCLVFSVGVMGGLLCFSEELGMVIYGSSEVGHFIRVMAFLMPVMYMDTVTDGMLRGLGEQLYAMQLNIIDSLGCTALVYFLLPKFALYGYIAILYVSEIVNFSFSLKKLNEKAGVKGLLPDIIKSLVCALGAYSISQLLMKTLLFSGERTALVLGVVFYTAVYFVLTAGMNLVTLRKTARMLLSKR